MLIADLRGHGITIGSRVARRALRINGWRVSGLQNAKDWPVPTSGWEVIIDPRLTIGVRRNRCI